MKIKSDESGLLFFFPALPAVSVSIVRTLGQNRTGWGGGGGVRFELATAGLVISGHVDLCVVIYRGIKHTWRCLQTGKKAGFTQKEGEHKVLWSVTASLQAAE